MTQLRRMEYSSTAIERIRIKEEELKGNNPELSAMLGRFTCVLVSGYLENAVSDILGEFASNQASPRVARYVDRQMRRFQNPRFGKIVEVLEKFDPQWGEKIQSEYGGNSSPVRSAVNSVNAQRNLIAHGESSSISMKQILKYYGSCRLLVQAIRKQVLGY